MSALRGLVAGTLGLSLLEAVVSTSKGPAAVGTFTGLATSAINRLVDPAVPLVPDLRQKLVPTNEAARILS